MTMMILLGFLDARDALRFPAIALLVRDVLMRIKNIIIVFKTNSLHNLSGEVIP